VDAALRQAEDSLKLNPRVREGLLHRVVLRTGLDTLEICTVVLRVLARSLTDLAKEREPEPLFEPQAGAALEQLLSGSPTHRQFRRPGDHRCLPQRRVGGEAARRGDHHGRRHPRQARQLFLEEIQRDASQWQLQGAVLTEVNRIIAELDTEYRSRRLPEELDRCAREDRERWPRLTRLRPYLRVRGCCAGTAHRFPSF